MLILPGTYNESVTVSGISVMIRSRYLNTMNPDDIENTVVIAPANQFATFYAANVPNTHMTLHGLTIQHAGNGNCVYINDAGIATVERCDISGGYSGICTRNFASFYVYYCKIHDNTWYGITGSWDGAVVRYEYIVENTLIYGNGSHAIALDYSPTTFKKCTIVNNGGYGLTGTGGNWPHTLNSSIVWGNTLGSCEVGSVTARYSDIQGGWTGTGNINIDPCFNDPLNDDFTLAWNYSEKSPCIDTGDSAPTMLDPDGTRADMGYEPAIDHYVCKYSFNGLTTNNGWTWLCFPVIDNVLQNQNRIDHVLANAISGNPPLLNYIKWSDSLGDRLYQGLIGWVNGDHLVKQTQGYKNLARNGGYSVGVSGFRIPDDAEMSLIGEGEENWLGYFLPFSQEPEDAFASVWENLYSIQAQTWCMVRINEHTWLQMGDGTLNKGDMVVVKCYHTVWDFVWGQNEAELRHREQASDFTWEEEADYVPIFVSVENEEGLREVGVFIDGVCKGAAVFENGQAQVCAYIADEDEGEKIELRFSYEGRAPERSLRKGYVYDHKSGTSTPASFEIHRDQEYYLFTDSKDLTSPVASAAVSVSNFPNPFNPSTTVHYALPSAGDVKVEVYNVRGQRVRTLVDGIQTAGAYDVVWDGTTETGTASSSGVYFIRLQTDDKTVVRKALMMK